VKISLAVSPDADDQFMVRALLDGLVPTGGHRFEITSSPTDALNRIASGDDGPDVLAVSIAHYPICAGRYQLLPHGGSMGEGYGPVIVSREPLRTLHGARLAVPGLTTTAWLVTRLLLGADVQPAPVVVPIAPHERVFEALDRGEVDAALLIHEGRLTYADRGLHRVMELGESWAARSGGLPLPLGGNVIRRGLGEDTIREVSALLRASIAHGLDHLDDAVAWLLARGGPLTTAAQVRQYLSMYANARTLDYGPQGREAIRALFRDAAAAGLIALEPVVDFAP
jgi:1,4-dihydroxy-6-naphthoate synthase